MMKTNCAPPPHAVLLPLFCLGCAGLSAVVPAALKLGKSLLEAATANYSPEYGEVIDQLLTAMVTPASVPVVANEAGTAPQGKGLAIELSILKEVSTPTGTTLMAINDGEVLHDDGGGASGDKFKISFRSDRSCYVYIVAIDGTGWATSVFPGEESALGNPVDAGRSYLIPDGTRWYALDENRGIEHVYLLASFVRRPDLESIQAKFEAMERPERTNYRRVDEPAVAKRGIVAVGPGTPTRVSSESGDEQVVTPTSFLADFKGFDLVVTRWFEHQ